MKGPWSLMGHFFFFLQKTNKTKTKIPTGNFSVEGFCWNWSFQSCIEVVTLAESDSSCHANERRVLFVPSVMPLGCVNGFWVERLSKQRWRRSNFSLVQLLLGMWTCSFPMVLMNSSPWRPFTSVTETKIHAKFTDSSLEKIYYGCASEHWSCSAEGSTRFALCSPH